MDNIKDLPFITIGKYQDEEIIGIIGNVDNEFVYMYVLSENMSYNELIRFIDCGEEWWWETNRLIPINIVLRHKWMDFKKYMIAYPTTLFEIISGPVVSVDKLIIKNIKRKKVNLLKK